MINPENTKMELNVRAIRTFLSSFEKIYGRVELDKLIKKTGMPLEYFEYEDNWISFNYYCDVLNEIVDYTGDPEITYKFGLTAGTSKSWGIIKTILKTVSSCAYAYKTIISLSPRWTKVGKFTFINFKKNTALLELRLQKGLIQNRNNCLCIQGQLASIPTYYNLPPAKIKEIQCASNGADSCIYDISWRNLPYKKIGFYFVFTGILISLGLSQLIKLNIIDKSIFHFLFLIILPFACYSMWEIINSKITLKEHYKKTEEQNELLGKNLFEIEKSNEILQKKIEERTEELTASNKKIEENINELKSNEDELIRSGKSALIGALSEEISNKLIIPIKTIQVKLNETVQNKSSGESDNNIKNILINAQRAADRCEKIINDLLFISRNGNHSNHLEININMLIEECVIMANKEISDPDIKIMTYLSDNLPRIFANYNQLKQVIMIFLTNANDAITEHHKNKKDIKGEISISSFLKNKDILLEIKDTGCGIPKDVINKIFDPFFSTKTSSKRKGMGLTLSFNIIKKLGGKIEVESIPGKETTFKIYIPSELNIQ
jgi:signal transduction histidine kinase